MKKINWAIMGTGFISNSFARSFPKMKGASLYGVSGFNKEETQEFAEKYSIKNAFDTYETMLSDKEVDIVYMGIPTSVHYEWILKSLHQGKHVLCEKTITMNYAQLKECRDLAREKGLMLVEGLTSVFSPLMGDIKKIIDSGRLGPLHFITVTCGSHKEYSAHNRYFSPNLGGGAIFDIGCYAIGFANYFMSSNPTTILSEGVLAGTGVDLKSAYVLKNDQNELATVMIALRSKTEKIGIIACEEAFIRIEGFIRPRKAVITFRDGRMETYEYEPFGLEKEVETITKDLLEGKIESTVCPIDYTCSILQVMDTAREQWGYKFEFEKRGKNA